jgi:hypothetical protein
MRLVQYTDTLAVGACAALETLDAVEVFAEFPVIQD